MKISCRYCGRIHDKKYDCGLKPKRNNYKRKDDDKFRWTSAWKKKRNEIRDRDKYLCQICSRKIYPIHRYQYVYDNLEVHHAIKIKDRPDLALENSNLITLCEYHHEMAEKGVISLEIIQKIIDEQEKDTPRGEDIIIF